jgi:hypothetical protein
MRGPRSAFGDFPSHQRLCFYPSCGRELLWAAMAIDCDLFVFAEKDRLHVTWDMIGADFAGNGVSLDVLEKGDGFVRFRCNGKLGVVLWEDNNVVLERILRQGLKVHHFIGICDGCMEGGNYECVHDRPFLSRLLVVAADGMRYSTDHSALLKGGSSCRDFFDIHDRPFRDRYSMTGSWEPSWAHDEDLSPGSEKHGSVDASFELLGMIERYGDRDERGRYGVTPPFEWKPTQLQALAPFCSRRARPMVIEYRVAIRRHGQPPRHETLPTA